MNYSNTEAKLLELDPRVLLEPKWGNPRSSMNDADYKDLLASVKAQGIHTPIMVRSVQGGFEKLAGFRRCRAAIDANILTVPCIVRELSDQEAYNLAVSENVDRAAMSTLDEAKAFKKIVANHNGDLNAASSEMGWNKAKFERAIQLLRTSEKVQNLIGIKNDNGFVLSVGHAARLSILPEDQQDMIVDAVIANKMTVTVVKEKIERAAKRPLKSASFCTQSCHNCQFNTEFQTSLFEEETDANCTNVSCFNDKTQQHFEAKKVELEADYGKLVLLSTIDNPLTVHSSMVGEDQYNNGCLSCDKHCAVLADKGTQQGNILENQCLDTTCANKHAQALTKAQMTAKAKATPPEPINAPTNAPTNAPINAPINATSTQSAAPQATKAKGKASAESAIPKRLVLESQTALRPIATEYLLDHETYSLAIAVAAIKCQEQRGKSLESLVLELMSMDGEELEAEMMASITTLTNNTSNTNINMERLVLKAAEKHIPTYEQDAVKAWLPTEERLTAMTKTIRQQVLEQSGWASAYKNAHSDKEFQQLLGKKTDAQVKEILAFEFDWSAFAPTYYTKAIKEQRYNY